MGFFSKLFGGGSTNVTQTSTNKTEVGVTNQIANIMDLTALSEAVEGIGEGIEGALKASAEDTKKILTASILLDAQNDAKQTEVLENTKEQVLKIVRIGAIGGVGYLAWRVLK